MHLQVNAICTDLVFTYFICPAIVNPEPYGITDAPISYVCRFNLIQVAKIVQMLAMTKYEDVDSKVSDLYDLFEKVGIQNFNYTRSSVVLLIYLKYCSSFWLKLLAYAGVNRNRL